MKTLLNIKLHLSKKNIFTILVFILVLGGTTGCIQHKSDQKRLPALSFTVNERAGNSKDRKSEV